MIKALVVEDESSISDLILSMVPEIDNDIRIIGSCDNIISAEQKIKETNPELVFLDIMLPGGTAFDLLKNIGDINFEIIFVTAYNTFLEEAIKHAPGGYIQKPINTDDLRNALKHAKKRLHNGVNNQVALMLEQLVKKNEKQEKIAIATTNEYLFINIGDIVHCEGSNVYTYLYTKDKNKILSSYTLKQIMSALPEDKFFQVHKSHLIAIDQIIKYNSKDLLVTMSDNTVLPVSRRRKDELLEHFVRINRHTPL